MRLDREMLQYQSTGGSDREDTACDMPCSDVNG